MSPKGAQEREEFLGSSSHQDFSHSLQWASGSSGWDVKKHRVLIQDSWYAYERNNFSKPRLWHLCIYRKKLNYLTCDIWFSLTIIFYVQTTCTLLQSFYITWFLPSPSWSSFLRVNWDAVSWAWNTKNFHQKKKKSSQLLGCDSFLSLRGNKEKGNDYCMWLTYDLILDIYIIDC